MSDKNDSKTPEAKETTTMLMDKDAWTYYTASEDGRHQFRNYLIPDQVRRIADVLGRPLTLDEMKLLVASEGVTKCSLEKCGKDFIAVKFVIVNKSLLDLAKAKGKIDEEVVSGEGVSFAGCAFVTKKAVRTYCGSPYFFVKEIGDYRRAHSHLGVAQQEGEGFGKPIDEAEKDFEELHKRIRENQETRNQIGQQLGRNRRNPGYQKPNYKVSR